MRHKQPPPWSTNTAELYVDYAVRRALHGVETTRVTVNEARRRPRVAWAIFTRYLRRKVLAVLEMPKIPALLILIWFALFYWGEVWVFDSAIAECDWGGWETWATTSTPHHLALLSDPQLVDPHTYPGRPWPLSSLTIAHTDLYLKRSYRRIQTFLDPHTTIFLGDLFDGGREWATPTTVSPETQYRKYKKDFWLREYNRFASIFLRDWSGEQTGEADVRTRTRRDGRRIIASLPGNHDLGFGHGIQVPVRDRFVAYFGEGNRVDVIGNHSIVSLDTVSLSAQERDEGGDRAIWGPSSEFVEGVGATRTAAVERHLDLLFDKFDGARDPHNFDDGDEESWKLGKPRKKYSEAARQAASALLDLSSPADRARIVPFSPPQANHDRQSPNYPDIPTILLTHVPLYRDPNTPCGPLREKNPSIPIAAGYQYQNTLTPALSEALLGNAGLSDTLSNVFSGDDHDYCEVYHREPSGVADTNTFMRSRKNGGRGVREITVKSLSWAMGVRRPGFLLASLWNPVDEGGRRRYSEHGASAGRGQGGPMRQTGEAGKIEEGRDTVQTRLCLLPDQLAIFLRYLVALLLSLLVLLVHALRHVYFLAHHNLQFHHPPRRDRHNRNPLLPTTNLSAKKDSGIPTIASGSLDDPNPVQARSAHSRRLSLSNGRDASSDNDGDGDGDGEVTDAEAAPILNDEKATWSSKRKLQAGRGALGSLGAVLREWARGLAIVAAGVLPLYVWFWRRW